MQYALYVPPRSLFSLQNSNPRLSRAYTYIHTYSSSVPAQTCLHRMQPHITNFASTNTEQHLIKLPTGPAKAPSGP